MCAADDSVPAFGMPQLDGELVEAIQDGRLRQVLGELSAVRPRMTRPALLRLEEVRHAVAAIDAAVETERQRLIQQLATAAVQVSGGAGRLPDRPLHLAALEVAAGDATRAAAVLETAGYRRIGPAGPGAWRAVRATQTGCSFIRRGHDPFRVELAWTPRWRLPGRVIPRLLTPHQSDLDLVRLPAWLWPAYLVVHLLRLPARRFRRRHEPPELGPFLETPADLIEPMLRCADLSANDVLVDLGCGDGRIPIHAARVFGCRARGVETNRDLVARARASVVAAGVGDRVDVVCGDAATAALDDASVVVAFLPVATVERLLPSVLGRLRPGARFVAHEQERLRGQPADVRVPLVSPAGISVAHRWNR